MNYLNQIFHNSVIQKLFYTIVFILLNLLIKFLIHKRIDKRKISKSKKHERKKMHTYRINALLVIAAMIVWLQNIRSVGTILGILGAGLTVALQEIILSFAGWVFIIIRHPFDIGDRVEVDGIIGDVIDMRVFQFTVLEVKGNNFGNQSTARLVHFPNNIVFRKPVFNSTKEFDYIWDEMGITFTFESNWKLAEKKIREYIMGISEGTENTIRKEMKHASKSYPIEYSIITPTVYVKLKDNGIFMVVRYMVKVREQRKYKDLLSRKVLEMVDANRNINLAYPTYRIIQ
jgi:small-conductance mechanosensitive channel